LEINLITKNIYDMGISEELYNYYSKYVFYLDTEDYINCKEQYEKIINYNEKQIQL
jgi:hypothetical protein